MTHWHAPGQCSGAIQNCDGRCCRVEDDLSRAPEEPVKR